MEYEFVYGRRPVLEALRGFREVFCILGTKEGLQWLRKKTRCVGDEMKVPLQLSTKQQLHNMLKRADHQGLAAKVQPYEYISLKKILRSNFKIVLIADSLTDPQNLGAIIRTSYLCGVGAVIIPKTRSASVSSVVVHASAGATEYIPIARLESIPHAIQMLRENGYCVVAACKPENSAIPLDRFMPSEKMALVLGSEGEGISQKALQRCDKKITIPQKGVIDSFNVAVAAGIILHHIAMKMGLLTPNVERGNNKV